MARSVIRGHRDLVVWQKAMYLFVGTSRAIRKMPYPERDDLGRQIRRAAFGVPMNIAEGHGRDHLGDYLRSLSVAKGEVGELDTGLRAVRAISLLPPAELDPLLALADEVSRMLTVLSRKLRRRPDLRMRSRRSAARFTDLEPRTSNPERRDTIASPPQTSGSDSHRPR